MNSPDTMTRLIHPSFYPSEFHPPSPSYPGLVDAIRRAWWTSSAGHEAGTRVTSRELVATSIWEEPVSVHLWIHGRRCRISALRVERTQLTR